MRGGNWGFTGVLCWWSKSRYLLKSLNSLLLKVGPLSLSTVTGIPRAVNILSNFGIFTTSRYYPVCMESQNSTATSCQGRVPSPVKLSPLGMGGSAVCALLPFCLALETTVSTASTLSSLLCFGVLHVRVARPPWATWVPLLELLSLLIHRLLVVL